MLVSLVPPVAVLNAVFCMIALVLVCVHIMVMSSAYEVTCICGCGMSKVYSVSQVDPVLIAGIAPDGCLLTCIYLFVADITYPNLACVVLSILDLMCRAANHAAGSYTTIRRSAIN